MEQRKSERVQFFQLPTDGDLVPVWVFQLTQGNPVLGLLLDIGIAGAQILTDRANPLAGTDYNLIIHGDEAPGAGLLSVRVRRLWSKAEGTLYLRNGFVFEAGMDMTPIIASLRAARDSGHQWLRCELAPA